MMRLGKLPPADPEAMGRFWAEAGLPDDVADRWATEGLDARSDQRVLAAYWRARR